METGAHLRPVVERIVETRAHIGQERAVLAALSGIDASGKGYLAAQIAAMLGARALNVATINIDGWLNLPERRFSDLNPAEHFYLHAIRFEEMFAQLVLPLRARRSILVEMDFAAETATEYVKRPCQFDGIDVIVLEGIFLLKRAFQSYYDLSIWIDCSFDTALQRAVARAQEGLPPEETVKAYQSIYFPAQRIHLQRDCPREAATFVVRNDT